MRCYYSKIAGMGYASIRLAFTAGKLYEPQNHPGIAHLAEHMFFRQFGDVHMEQLYRIVNQMGATLHGSTDANFIAFDITVRTEHVPDTVKLLLGSLQTNDWEEDDFAIEKKVVLRQIIERGEYSLNRRLNKRCYGGTTLTDAGTSSYESVEAISLDDLNKFKRKTLRSSNSALIIVGDLGNKESEVQRIVQKYISDERAELPVIKPKAFKKRTRSDDILVPGADETCDVILFFDCDSSIPSWILSYLLDVVGTGDGALLPWELKEKRGWVGDIDTDFNLHRDFSNLELSYSIDGEYLLESIKIIFDVLYAVTDHISENAVNMVKPFYTNYQYPRMYSEESVYKICTQGFLREEDWENDVLCEMANSITSEDLAEYSKQVFSPRNLTSLVYYNNSIVKRKSIRALFDNYRMNLY